MKDSYGNFIIQKLLYMLNETQKLSLLNEIERVIPKLGKKNIQTKWRRIIEQHQDLNAEAPMKNTILNDNSHFKVKNIEDCRSTLSPLHQNQHIKLISNQSSVHSNYLPKQTSHNMQYNAWSPNLVSDARNNSYQAFYWPYGQIYSMSNPNASYDSAYAKSSTNRILVPVIMSIPAFY